MAGGRFSDSALSARADCAAAVRTGEAAAAAAEVRRKRRRLSMGATSVLGKIRARGLLEEEMSLRGSRMAIGSSLLEP